MENKRRLVGVIGGLGPMASAYFYELLTERTKASCDQEHIDCVISSRASTPDRTAFLVGKCDKSPLSALCEEAKKLEAFGADFIVITCNTSHCFIDEIRKSVSIPVPGIIEETAKFLSLAGAKKVGIMATDGTVETGLYQTQLEKRGIEAVVPDKSFREMTMSLIYDDVKQGREPNLDNYYSVAQHLTERGCDRIILGCTELSLINKKIGGAPVFCDAMEVLAYRAVCLGGGEPQGFPAEFELIRNENL